MASRFAARFDIIRTADASPGMNTLGAFLPATCVAGSDWASLRLGSTSSEPRAPASGPMHPNPGPKSGDEAQPAQQKSRTGVQPCTAYRFAGVGVRTGIGRRSLAFGKARPGCLLVTFAGGCRLATGNEGPKAECSEYGIQR
jgi:hypothetical protein